MSKYGEFSSDEALTAWLKETGPDRCMRLLAEFWFDDPKGKRWEVPEGYDKMDGASIPRALWSLIGSPYTGDYRRASIVHDYACDQAGGDAATRAAADRMFYYACREGGCSWAFAVVLYIGVRIGAWTNLVETWRSVRTSKDDDYRLSPDINEQSIQADYRQIAERVLEQGEIEDAKILEQRVADAALAVVGKSLR
jgi:hypothetical protein